MIRPHFRAADLPAEPTASVAVPPPIPSPGGGWRQYAVNPSAVIPMTGAPRSAFDAQEGGSHYKGMAIQPAAYILANNIPWAEGCVVKYVSRWRSKGGIEDLRKAKHFLEMLIEHETAKGAL